MLNQNDVTSLYWGYQAKAPSSHSLLCTWKKKACSHWLPAQSTQSRNQNPLAFWSAGLWVRDWRVTCFSTTIFVFDSFSSNGLKQNREIKNISKKWFVSHCNKKNKVLVVIKYSNTFMFYNSTVIIWCFDFIGPSGKLWSWLDCCPWFFPAIPCPLCSNPSFELVWVSLSACWAVWMSY